MPSMIYSAGYSEDHDSNSDLFGINYAPLKVSDWMEFFDDPLGKASFFPGVDLIL